MFCFITGHRKNQNRWKDGWPKQYNQTCIHSQKNDVSKLSFKKPRFLLPFCSKGLKHISHITPFVHSKTHKPIEQVYFYTLSVLSGTLDHALPGFLPRVTGPIQSRVGTQTCSAFFLFLPSISNYQNQDDAGSHRMQGGRAVASVRWCESWLELKCLSVGKKTAYVQPQALLRCGLGSHSSWARFFNAILWASCTKQWRSFRNTLLCIKARSGKGGGKIVNAFRVWNEWQVMKTMRKLK